MGRAQGDKNLISYNEMHSSMPVLYDGSCFCNLAILSKWKIRDLIFPKNPVKGFYIQEIFPKSLIFYFTKNSNKW